MLKTVHCAKDGVDSHDVCLDVKSGMGDSVEWDQMSISAHILSCVPLNQGVFSQQPRLCKFPLVPHITHTYSDHIHEGFSIFSHLVSLP